MQVEDRKTCTTCEQSLPFDAFSYRGSDRRRKATRCRACAASYMRKYRDERRAQVVIGAAKQIARTANWQRSLTMVGELVHRYGGPKRFAALWVETINKASAARPGSSDVLKAYLAVMNLISACSEAGDSPENESDLSALSDEELRERLRSCPT